MSKLSCERRDFIRLTLATALLPLVACSSSQPDAVRPAPALPVESARPLFQSVQALKDTIYTLGLTAQSNRSKDKNGVPLYFLVTPSVSPENSDCDLNPNNIDRIIDRLASDPVMSKTAPKAYNPSQAALEAITSANRGDLNAAAVNLQRSPLSEAEKALVLYYAIDNRISNMARGFKIDEKSTEQAIEENDREVMYPMFCLSLLQSALYQRIVV